MSIVGTAIPIVMLVLVEFFATYGAYHQEQPQTN
jgi:hypothetical protein